MTQAETTGRDGWMQLACLLLSIALHTALGAIGWQGFTSPPDSSAPILVALVEKPAALTGGSSGVAQQRPLAAAATRAKSSAPHPAARSRAATPATTPAAAQPAVLPAFQPQPEVVTEPAAVVPLATALPSPSPQGEGADAGAAGGAGGTGAGSTSGQGGYGPGGGSGSGGGGGNGNLIKATPRYESNPPPPYPRLARQNRWEGTVRLRAWVSAAGEIDSISLERSSGHEVLDRSALDGVKRWRFIPATRGGVPVPCEVSIPVAFRLTE